MAKKARVRSISEIEHATTRRAVRRFSPFDWLRQPFSWHVMMQKLTIQTMSIKTVRRGEKVGKAE